MARYRAIIAATRAHPSAHMNLVGALLQARDAEGTPLTDDEIIGHLHLIAVTGTGQQRHRADLDAVPAGPAPENPGRPARRDRRRAARRRADSR